MPRDTSDDPVSANELACTSCRTRKLKCNRVKPACDRCAKLKIECAYPESRRKPAFKRRNVKELEARLAQVENLLKKTGDKDPNATIEEVADEEIVDFNFADFTPATEDVFLQGLDFTVPTGEYESDPMLSTAQMNDYASAFSCGAGNKFPQTHNLGGELISLGLSEPLPPFEVMEELNRLFFERQQLFIPVIHPARYMQSFYSAPHMKPPMCLQYAVWAIASNGTAKYGHLHDIFYRRARQYAEADELRGHGEHFITVQHAQAWCLITTDEAKSMHFTRAAMSSAKAVRLVEMMGLHRLDTPPIEVSPTLVPPKNWSELEERRRTFWGVFCIDSHCSISTGWPHLVDDSEVTTHLPASESAFAAGEPEETCRLDEAFRASTYSSFAGAILVCHLFNQILRHVHRPLPNDNPQDYEYGGYWQRHREIDNTLSNAFMYLPENLRLPEHYRDQTAIHTNLNYHASVICLHLDALEKIEEYSIPNHAKRTSENRLFTAAQEIVDIMKMTSHMPKSPRSPMSALALYCAASVFIHQCKESQSPKHTDDLNFLITAMDAIGREHMITRAFLKQVLLDIERNDLAQIVRIPMLDHLPHVTSMLSHNIPLLARSKLSRHSAVQPPLPGLLPLGNPKGAVINEKIYYNGVGHPVEETGGSPPEEANANKRKRTSPGSSGPSCSRVHEVDESPAWAPNDTISTDSSPPESDPTGQKTKQDHPRFNCLSEQIPYAWSAPGQGPAQQLPHRTGSSKTSCSSASATMGASPYGVSQGSTIVPRPGEALVMAGPEAGGGESRVWDSAGLCVQAQFANSTMPGSEFGSDPWNMAGQDGNFDWDAIISDADVQISAEGNREAPAADSA